MKKRNKNRGSVVLEAVIVLIPFLMAWIFMVECFRRTALSLVLHHSAFNLVRLRALGASEARAKQPVTEFLKGAGYAFVTREWLLSEQKTKASALQTSVWYRFPQLFSFAIGGGQTKHHLELTEKCSFLF